MMLHHQGYCREKMAAFTLLSLPLWHNGVCIISFILENPLLNLLRVSIFPVKLVQCIHKNDQRKSFFISFFSFLPFLFNPEAIQQCIQLLLLFYCLAIQIDILEASGTQRSRLTAWKKFQFAHCDKRTIMEIESLACFIPR